MVLAVVCGTSLEVLKSRVDVALGTRLSGEPGRAGLAAAFNDLRGPFQP